MQPLGVYGYADASLSTAEDTYPFIAYSLSLYSLGTDNTMLFEELASIDLSLAI